MGFSGKNTDVAGISYSRWSCWPSLGLLHWQVDSLPLSYRGSLSQTYRMRILGVECVICVLTSPSGDSHVSKEFMFYLPGGSTGTSPTTSSTGTPSPSASSHLLSPSCSPPTFHLAPNTFNVGCRESQLCNLNLSDYPPCARSNMAALQSYPGLSDSGYNRLQSGTTSAAQPSETFMPQRTPSLISGIPTPPSLPSNSKMEAYGGQLGSFPTSQFQYVMQAGNAASSSSSPHMFGGSHMQQSSYNAFSLHNPYNLYGYNFPTSPRLAASPEKLSASQSTLLCSSPSNGAFGERQYLPTGMEHGMHMISPSPNNQQATNTCDGRQYGAVPGSSSQMSVHMV